MRTAVCQFVENLSLVHFPLDPTIVDLWLNALRECLPSADLNIQKLASTAITSLIAEYLLDESDQHSALLGRFLAETTGNHQQARMGNSLAVGLMPKTLLTADPAGVVQHLCLCARITEKTVQWAEARKNALGALAQVSLTVGISDSNPGVLSSHFCFHFFIELTFKRTDLTEI